jgi:hypothetical protein
MRFISLSLLLLFGFVYLKSVHAAISINATSAIKNDTISISVNVTSLFEISKVTATIKTASFDLIYMNGYFTGKTDISAFLHGSYSYQVIAIDVKGDSGMIVGNFLVDRPPRLVITSPLNGAVASPYLPISIKMIDDANVGPSTKIIVHIEDAPLITVNALELNSSVSLYPPEFYGTLKYLTIWGVDSVGQETPKAYIDGISCDTSSRLKEVIHFDGGICAIDSSKILYGQYLDGNNIDYINSQIFSINDSSTISIDSNLAIDKALITSNGAVYSDHFTIGRVNRNLYLYLYKNDTAPIISSLAGLNFDAKKHFVAFCEGTGVLILLDCLNNISDTICKTATSFDLSKTGSIAYIKGDSLYCNKNGTTERIFDSVQYIYSNPLIDENDIVYTKANNTNKYIVANLSGKEVVLSTYPNSVSLTKGLDYKINSNWIAFTQQGTTGQKQIWLRFPSGEIKQISFFSKASSIENIAPNGQIMSICGDQRYLYDTSGNEINVCSKLGKSYFDNNQWYIAIGGVLFSIDTSTIVSKVKNDLKNTSSADFHFQQFSKRIVIAYSQVQPNNLRLSIYSVNGKRLQTISTGIKSGIEKKYCIDLQTFASGIYLLRATNGKHNQTFKFVVSN